MTTSTALTREEVDKLVSDWYHALDVHVPLDEALTMVADEGLEFHIPEGVKSGRDGFRELYHFWTHTFFDEVHTMKELEITPEGERAHVKLLVNWQARSWNPPEARSNDINFNAGQTWIVQRDPQSGRPVILQYIVETFTPVEATAAK